MFDYELVQLIRNDVFLHEQMLDQDWYCRLCEKLDSFDAIDNKLDEILKEDKTLNNGNSCRVQTI